MGKSDSGVDDRANMVKQLAPCVAEYEEQSETYRRLITYNGGAGLTKNERCLQMRVTTASLEVAGRWVRYVAERA